MKKMYNMKKTYIAPLAETWSIEMETLLDSISAGGSNKGGGPTIAESKYVDFSAEDMDFGF